MHLISWSYYYNSFFFNFFKNYHSNSLLLSAQAERDAIESELKNATTDMKSEFLRALAQDGAINEPVLSVESIGKVYGDLQRQVISVKNL